MASFIPTGSQRTMTFRGNSPHRTALTLTPTADLRLFMAALRFRNLVEVLAESGDTYGYSLQQRKDTDYNQPWGEKHTLERIGKCWTRSFQCPLPAESRQPPLLAWMSDDMHRVWPSRGAHTAWGFRVCIGAPAHRHNGSSAHVADLSLQSGVGMTKSTRSESCI